MIPKQESFRKGIAASTAISAGGRVFQFLINPLIAYLLGANSRTDLYFFCINTITLLAIFLTAPNAAVIIPRAIARRKESEKESNEFVASVALWYLIISCALAVLMTVFPVEALSAVSRFDRNVIVDGLPIAIGVIWLLPMTVLNISLTDILVSYRYFTMPALMTALTAVSTIIFVIVGSKPLGELSPALGMLAGTGIQSLVLLYYVRKLVSFPRPKLRLTLTSDAYRDLGFTYLGQTATTFSGYIPFLLLSGFGVGCLTALSFAQTAAGVMLALIVYQYSAVAGIRFNELSAEKNESVLGDVFLTASRFLIFVLIPIAFLMSVFSSQIILTLFGGRKVDSSVSGLSTQFLTWLAWLPPLLAVNTMVGRINMALQKITAGVCYQIIANLSLATLLYWTVSSYGPESFAVGSVIFYTSNVAVLAIYCYFIIPTLPYSEMLTEGLKAFMLNIIVALPLLLTGAETSGWTLMWAGLYGVYHLGTVVALNQVIGLEPEVKGMVGKYLYTGCKK